MDSNRIPYLLDDHGDVWAFKKPLTFEEPFRLPNLHQITQIAPYIALDIRGHVFNWGLHPIKTAWNESGEPEEPEYLAPKEVKGITGAIRIASDGDEYFAAVVGNQGIFDWMKKTDDSSFSNYSISSGPIRKISSRTDVVDWAINWTPELLSDEGKIVRPRATSVVGLFENGDVLGWGVDAHGVLQHGIDMKAEKLLTQLPGATSLARTGAHIVVLTADGVPKYWGGCQPAWVKRSGWQGSDTKLAGVSGYVVDVQNMYINLIDDHQMPSFFKKRDGSIWLAYAPIPPGLTKQICGRFHDQGDVRQFPVGAVEVKQMVGVGTYALILDANHQLWAWDAYREQLEQVLVKFE